MSAGLLLSVLLASASSSFPDDSPPAPLFHLRTVDGLAGSGPIKRIADDWSVSLAGEKPIKASGKEIVSLRRVGQAMPPWPMDEHLLFANGDRIAGSPAELRSERLRFQASLGKFVDITVPLTAVSVIWLAMPDGATDREAVLRPWQNARRSRDVVILRNRDLVEGSLSDLDAQAVRLRGVDRKEIRLAQQSGGHRSGQRFEPIPEAPGNLRPPGFD